MTTEDMKPAASTVVDASEWVWWKIMTPIMVRPSDFIHPFLEGSKPQRHGAVSALQEVGLTDEQILAIFHRVDRAPFERAPDTPGETLKKRLEGRCFLENEFETWVRLARLIGRPIHLNQGVPPFRDCESYYKFTVYPNGRFKLPPDKPHSSDPVFLRPAKNRITTLQRMIAQEEKMEREYQEQLRQKHERSMQEIFDASHWEWYSSTRDHTRLTLKDFVWPSPRPSNSDSIRSLEALRLIGLEDGMIREIFSSADGDPSQPLEELSILVEENVDKVKHLSRLAGRPIKFSDRWVSARKPFSIPRAS